MLEDRNVQLGCGFQTVEGRGVAVILSADAMMEKGIPEQRFTFQAKLCDSAEELQKSFSAAINVSASAHGADLGANVGVSKTTDAARFDAYYMMELEFREERFSLGMMKGNGEILDPGIRQELESLDTVEKWEEFYRTKGDHVVNSVTYGRKLIIIVSLSHKVRNDQLRRMLEAKVGFSASSIANGQANLHLESNLKALAEENISSVQIYAIGDSDPDFLKEIDKLVELKEKIKNFVNSTSKQESDAGRAPNLSDEKPRLRTLERQKGVVIAYSTCSYIDFLDKHIENRQSIEKAYDQMLQATNRASRYLEAISQCHSRLDMLLRSMDFFLAGHDGSFVLSAATEESVGQVRGTLRKHATTLRSIAREVVSEAAGLSEDGRRRRMVLEEVRGCLGLLDDITTDLDLRDTENVRLLLTTRLSLIDKYEAKLKGGVDGLHLKPRILDLLTAFDESVNEKKRYAQSFNDLRVSFDQRIRPVLAERTDWVEGLMRHYSTLLSSLDRKLKPEQGILVDNEKKLLSALLTPSPKPLGEEKIQDAWFEQVVALREFLRAEFKSLLEVAAQSEPEVSKKHKTSLTREQILQNLVPFGDLLEGWCQVARHYSEGRSAHSYRNSATYELEQIEGMIRLLKDISFFDVGRFKAIGQDLDTLRDEIDVSIKDIQGKLQMALDACQLKGDELSLLKNSCETYVQEVEKLESVDGWWQSRWRQVLQASQDLDRIVSNQRPDGAPDHVNQVFNSIDFKHEAFLVGVLPVMRGWGFHKNEFNGGDYQKMRVPSAARFLRFKVDGANLPARPVSFNLLSKPKVNVAGRKSAHRTLYKEISPGDPIYPIQPHMRDVAKLLEGQTKTASLTRGEELMHGMNETVLYRKVRIAHLHFEGGEADIPLFSMSVMVYAQMGKGLEPLGLADDAPRGRADYGVRFRMVDTSYTSPQRFVSHAQEVQQVQYQMVAQQVPQRRQASFFNSPRAIMQLAPQRTVSPMSMKDAQADEQATDNQAMPDDVTSNSAASNAQMSA